jgi:hypothetical protein
MRVMVSSRVSGGGLGEKLAQAHGGRAPRGRSGWVMWAWGACSPGLGREAVAGCGPQQFVLTGLHELVVDVHVLAPFGRFRVVAWAGRPGLRRESPKGVEGLLQSC